jgi:hypothetical protein
MNAPRFLHPPRLGVCEDEDCPLCAPMTVSDDLVPFFSLTPDYAQCCGDLSDPCTCEDCGCLCSHCHCN